MQAAKTEPLDFLPSHFNNGQLGGGNILIPNGMPNFTPGPMTASPGMLSLNPHMVQNMGGPPPGMMAPPPTTPQVDAHTPGGPSGVTPRLSHVQNPMNQSPGMRPNSSSGPPGPSGPLQQQGTPSLSSFNAPPPPGNGNAQKRKATSDGGPDGSGLGAGDGQGGPPSRRQRTSGSVSTGNNPGYGPGPGGDGGAGDSPSEGVNTRGKGRKSPVQSKAQVPQARNKPTRRAGGA